LLTGIPLAASDVPAELTTPTGAAIVATLASEFGSLPAMRIERIGYGAGTRDLEQQPNLLRLLMGQVAAAGGGGAWRDDPVWVLETNLDDVPGEWIAYCGERLLAAGALDIYSTPIQMKKNRPGCLLTVLCREADVTRLEGIIFAETGSLGIRRWQTARHVLDRQAAEVSTPWGAVAGKLAHLATGEIRFAPEYESCRQLATATGRPLRDIYRAAQQAHDLSTTPAVCPDRAT
jgi:uncharacterized protein (DUF111 family)